MKIKERVIEQMNIAIENDWLRMGQRLINALTALNENNKDAIISSIFYMDDKTFLKTIWKPQNNIKNDIYEVIDIRHWDNVTIQQEGERPE